MQDCSFLSSGVCPSVGEASACFLAWKAGTCPLVGGPGSWHSGRQSCIKGYVQRQFGVQEVSDNWGCILPFLTFGLKCSSIGAYKLLVGARSSCRNSKCLPPARGHVGPSCIATSFQQPPTSPGDLLRPIGRSEPGPRDGGRVKTGCLGQVRGCTCGGVCVVCSLNIL